MAAIARFVSFDGGIAFSDSVLKIQKRDEERGRLIPIDSVAGLEVDEPLLGGDGCIRVRIGGKKPSMQDVLFFEDDQYDEALRFKAAFDSFMGQAAPELPPLEMFQPTAIANRPPRVQARYTKQESPRQRQPVRQARPRGRFRWWYAAIAVVFIAILATPGKKDDKEKPQQESAAYATMEPTAITEPTAEGTEIERGQYTLPDGMMLNFSPSVRNDETGRWRISTTSDSIVPADHAPEYYNALFSSDDEIHAIWNATLNTTTRITVSGGMLYVDTLEYVDGEEHDANLLFSGNLLDSKIINIETGQEVSHGYGEEPTVVGYTSPPMVTEPPVQTQAPATPQPQAGTTYVLNTNTMKFHNPLCHDVGKINAANRQDYTGTRDEVIALGYSPCGHCHP